MAKTEHYYTKFELNNYYHVYNRSIDRKPMFCNTGNYDFFMKRYDKYLSPVIDTYAFCLLGNHFHLLIKPKTPSQSQDLTTFGKLSNLPQPQPQPQNLTTFEKLSNLPQPQPHPQNLTTFGKLSNLTTHDIVSHQFQMFFQSYAMAFNKQQFRIGTLFQTPFKRALVNSNEYLIRLVYYIHANPQLHGLIPDFRDWRWSSYFEILDARPNNTIQLEVLNWWGGKKQYIDYHSEKRETIDDKNLSLEDDDTI